MDWLWWLAAAFGLGLIEILLLDVFVLMLLGGALAGAAAAALGAPVPLQFIVAGVTSVGLVFVARPWATRLLSSQTPDIAMGVDNYLGRLAHTETEVTHQGGRIKLLGELWSARLADPSNGLNPPAAVPANADVLVIEIDGATAVVMPASAPSVIDVSQPQGGLAAQGEIND